jgi:hypothetical protein
MLDWWTSLSVLFFSNTQLATVKKNIKQLPTIYGSAPRSSRIRAIEFPKPTIMIASTSKRHKLNLSRSLASPTTLERKRSISPPDKNHVPAASLTLPSIQFTCSFPHP